MDTAIGLKGNQIGPKSGMEHLSRNLRIVIGRRSRGHQLGRGMKGVHGQLVQNDLVMVFGGDVFIQSNDYNNHMILGKGGQ
jgi:hypothetical protein